MTSRLTIARSLPRLLFCIAVVICALGVTEGSAAPAHASPHGTTVAAHHDTAPAAEPQHPVSGTGHAGHGAEDHGANCMVASGSGAFASAAAPIVLGTSALPAGLEPARLHGEPVPAVFPRPPDLTTLCLQRV